MCQGRFRTRSERPSGSGQAAANARLCTADATLDVFEELLVALGRGSGCVDRRRGRELRQGAPKLSNRALADLCTTRPQSYAALAVIRSIVTYSPPQSPVKLGLTTPKLARKRSREQAAQRSQRWPRAEEMARGRRPIGIIKANRQPTTAPIKSPRPTGRTHESMASIRLGSIRRCRRLHTQNIAYSRTSFGSESVSKSNASRPCSRSSPSRVASLNAEEPL
jgi:hypothetical protein